MLLKVIKQFYIISIIFMSHSLCANSTAIKVLTKLEQSKLQDKILASRLDNLLPELMRRNKIDCWVVVSDEYNEDPVMKTLLPSSRVSARRLSVVIFLDHGTDRGVERLLFARFQEPELYNQIWDINSKAEQWHEIIRAISEFAPRKIAINYSDTWGHADGMSKSNYSRLIRLLGPSLSNKVVSAEALAVSWLETRTPIEIEAYRKTLSVSRKILESVLLSNSVAVGETTITELKWKLVQKVSDLGLSLWFQPFVSIKRSDAVESKYGNLNDSVEVIQAGDIVYLGLGISYLGFNSDTQENAYILRKGESKVPKYLSAALKNSVALQNIIARSFKVGLTGNQVLKSIQCKAKLLGIDATIYSHPIGLHGHGAGAIVGLWEQQNEVKKGGDKTLSENTAYAIEGTTHLSVPEWGTDKLSISLAHVAFFDGKNMEFLAPRQSRFHIVQPLYSRSQLPKRELNDAY